MKILSIDVGIKNNLLTFISAVLLASRIYNWTYTNLVRKFRAKQDN